MLPTRKPTLLLLIALVLAGAASIVAASLYRTLLSTSGLTAETWAGTGFRGSPIIHTQDAFLQTDTVHATAARVEGPFSTAWRGYLFVPVTGRYRFVIVADDRASIDVDRRRVSAAATYRGSGYIELNRGLHPILLRYEDEGGRQVMEVLWGRDTGTPSRLQPLWLLPEIRPFREIRARRVLAWAMPVVAVFWSVVLLVAAAVAVGALVGRVSENTRRSFAPVVLLVAAVTFACGLWWGLPDFYGWASDELGPGDVNDALARHFSGGWATIYPPLHYAVLGIFTAPFHVLAGIGLLELDQLHVTTAVFVVQRLVSVVMALGTLGLVFALGSTITPRAGAFAAAIVSVALPYAYYAKIANVDVPYVFWLTLSMVFYVRMHRTTATADFLFFVVAGVAAIATKDQAYGFYLLPAAVIIVRAVRRWRTGTALAGAPSPRVLTAMIALAIVALLVFDNVLFNFAGFVEHVRIITGPGSQDFRMYERTLSGQAVMLRDAIWQLGGAMSWPLFLMAVIAVAGAWWTRVTTVRLLLLPVLSYYVTVIAVVGYHYDRFFIGPVIILAVATGWWLDTWLAPGRRMRAVRLSVVWCALAYAFARVAALDAMMIFDSRYTVEQWLLHHAPADARIAAAGHYLPRGGTLFWIPIAQDPDALATLQPDFVIVNPAFTRRWSPSSAPGQFYAALTGGSPYKVVLRYRMHLWWSPLQFERRFNEAVDDPYSNLAKVNPLIEVYGR
jgi:hypothetical protein